MLRTASAADLNALVKLRCDRYGTAQADAAGWLQNVAGLDNVLVVERPDGTPAAMLAAVPVQYRHRQGVWFCGAAAGAEVPREMLLTRLLTGCMRAFAAKGYDFAVFAPETEEETQALEKAGFKSLLPLRLLQRPIQPDLLATAEFDSLTVRRLLEMRRHCQPGCVDLPESAMNEIITQLYRRGLTVVSDRRGYGLFYTKGDTLQFLELQADNDHCADRLLQAAREKTGAHYARIVLAENQPLYPGAGRRCGYGMIAFLRGEFPTGDMYFRMLL